jgi:hypothetical protein
VQVLVALPPPPAYHRRHMPLRARIDRGDVWLTAPDSRRVGGRRPALVLLARDGSREVALARWPTTIGGWQPFEEEDGSLNLRHGESPAGSAVWRDLLAGPAWYPPTGIPVQALLARSAGGPRARAELIGPGYRAAYGLMALVHEEPRAEALMDHGIRTHGSPSFLSVARAKVTAATAVQPPGGAPGQLSAAPPTARAPRRRSPALPASAGLAGGLGGDAGAGAAQRPARLPLRVGAARYR